MQIESHFHDFVKECSLDEEMTPPEPIASICTSLNAARILSMLCHILYHHAGEFSEFKSAYNGEDCVCLRRPEAVELLGLKLRAYDEALSSLRDEGFVRTEVIKTKDWQRTHIFLNKMEILRAVDFKANSLLNCRQEIY